jgi:uncharacterized membrane protein YeaQ/YmgE (transglycosylase-associated protein family)
MRAVCVLVPYLEHIMFLGTMGWIAFGVIIGFIASKSLNLGDDDPKMGIAMAGCAGLVGGWLYSLFSGAAVTGFNGHSLMFAGFAAIATLIAWHTFRHHSFSRY